MRERKIILSVATSADGYIARSDGSVDWLNRPRTVGDYGMSAFFKTIDTILLGRKTYDWSQAYVKKGGGDNFSSKVKTYVFTHKPPKKPDAKFEFVSEPIKQFAQRLRATSGKNIWLMGGGGVTASFLDAGELDEFIIHVIPTFIGEGIPLIAPDKRNVQLKLLESYAYDDGVVKLHYEVKR